MPKKYPPPRKYQVGDHIQASISNKIYDAVIKSVIESTSGVRITVAFGHDQVAIIHEWQVVPDQPRK
jgi:hypothetical protein